jgi:alpha-glucosidase (family GH31 glycosyl hydrolase)
MDKYIQMDFELSSDKVFGFGERVHEFQLNEGTYTMWASGQDSPYDDGKGRKGLYGVHPFILVQGGKNKDQFYGLFFRSSNMQTPIIRYTDDGKTILSYITIGG